MIQPSSTPPHPPLSLHVCTAYVAFLSRLFLIQCAHLKWAIYQYSTTTTTDDNAMPLFCVAAYTCQEYAQTHTPTRRHLRYVRMRTILTLLQYTLLLHVSSLTSLLCLKAILHTTTSTTLVAQIARYQRKSWIHSIRALSFGSLLYRCSDKRQ